MAYTQVDLSGLPAPKVIEELSFETILAEMKEVVALNMPELAPVLSVESETAVKILETCAAYVLLTRARVNDAAKSVMLAYATGADLDHLGALFGIERRIIALDLATGIATYEGDDEFRRRVQLAPEGYTSAGSRGAYEFHALSAHEDIGGVFVGGPDTPGLGVPSGNVWVYVMAREGNAAPPTEVLDAVTAALNAEEVRPLCDNVTVFGSHGQGVHVEATIHIETGPDAAVVEAEARAALDAYFAQVRQPGARVAVSALMAALHRPGVSRVDLVRPTADFQTVPERFPVVASLTLRFER